MTTIAVERPTLRPRVLANRFDGPTDLDGQFRLAEKLSTATFALPERYRGNAGDVLATMYQAQALDVAVMTALQNFVWSVDGRGAMSGLLISSLILRAGHHIEVLHHDRRAARMRLVRCDGRPAGEVEWTEEEAVAAGLFEKSRSPWKTYQMDMLWWRCLARLSRRYAPDVVLGMGYVPEELDEYGIEPQTQHLDEGEPVLEVAPDVAELLAGVDTMDVKTLHGVWRKAYKAGLFSTYAGTHNGIRMTVEQYLLQLKASKLTEGVTEPDLSVDAAAEETAAPVVDESAGAAAGDGVLPCGCSARAVIMAGGAHAEGCRAATAG